MATIAFIHANAPQVGGSDVSLYQTVQRCLDEGHRPVVVLARHSAIVAQYQALGVRVHHLAMPRLARSLNPFRQAAWLLGAPTAAVRLARLLRRERTELVYANDLHELPALWAGRLVRCPTLLRIRFGFTAPNAIRRGYMYLLAKSADCIACNSNYISRANFHDVPAAQNKLHTLYNWYDGSLPQTVNDSQSVREKWGLAPQDRVVLMPGRVQHWKGQHVLIEAAPRILEAVPEAVIVLMGDPVTDRRRDGYMRQLTERATALGVSQRVRFEPHAPDIARYYEAASVVVHASVSPEPFGRTVLEALWHGVPLVTVPEGGPTEIVGEPPAALFHEPGNAEALADQVVRLLKDQSLAAQLRTLGQARAQAFTSEAQWPRCRAAMDALLDGKTLSIT